ncbi:MAG: hypothetical protein HOO96_42910 [Polyangiaceae bacterium]|nr:hypothetical protein [Polyangiaceae bacterium]
MRFLGAFLALTLVSTLGCSSGGTSSSSSSTGGGSSSSSGGSSGGSSSSGTSCSTASSCINGACTCNDGPNKDKSCCDPSDAACAGKDTNCESYCKVCK